MGKSRIYRILNKRLVHGDSNLIDDDHEIRVIEDTNSNTVDLVNSIGESYVGEKKTDENKDALIYSDFYLGYITPYIYNDDQAQARENDFNSLVIPNNSSYGYTLHIGHIKTSPTTPKVIDYVMSSTSLSIINSNIHFFPRLCVTGTALPSRLQPNGIYYDPEENSVDSNYVKDIIDSFPSVAVLRYLYSTIYDEYLKYPSYITRINNTEYGLTGVDDIHQKSIYNITKFLQTRNITSEIVDQFEKPNNAEYMRANFFINRTLNGEVDPILIRIWDSQ